MILSLNSPNDSLTQPLIDHAPQAAPVPPPAKTENANAKEEAPVVRRGTYIHWLSDCVQPRISWEDRL